MVTLYTASQQEPEGAGLNVQECRPAKPTLGKQEHLSRRLLGS